VALRDVFGLEPSAHAQHQLHSGGGEWAETNCYVDLWVELLSSLGLEPLAALSFTLSADFEGDQWTFFKPTPADLRLLYGIQIEELSLWRSVLDHCREQIRRGCIPLIEADSFFLPDTHATDYRRSHVKTTIAPVFIDARARVLRYFHNAVFAELQGDDFDGLFRFVPPSAPDTQVAHWLPPYCEVVKLERAVCLPERELAERATALARGHFAWRPSVNPFIRYRERWPEHQELLLANDLGTYHGYTFSTLRQCGANYAMLAAFLRWHGGIAGYDATPASTAFDGISQSAKVMVMKLARAVHARKAGDFGGQLERMAELWHEGFTELNPVMEQQV
jgi:hypothetical protein